MFKYLETEYHTGIWSGIRRPYLVLGNLENLSHIVVHFSFCESCYTRAVLDNADVFVVDDKDDKWSSVYSIRHQAK